MRRFSHITLYSVELKVWEGRIVSKQIGIVSNAVEWQAMSWKYKMYRYYLGESRVKLVRERLT